MPKNSLLICCLALSALLGLTARADALQDAELADQAERRQIQAERQAAELQFAQQSLACQKRFAVNDCLDAVRARRNAALGPLQAQEIELDVRLRRARAARQHERVLERQREDAARESAQAAAALLTPSPAASQMSGEPAAVPVEARRASAAKKGESSRAVEQRRQAQLAEQQRRNQAHQTEIQQRNERREVKSRHAASLPLPSAADIAAATASAAASAPTVGKH